VPKPRLKTLKSPLLSSEQKIIIALYKEPLSPSTLLIITGLAPSVLYYNLRKLENKRLVRQDNGLYYLTEKGRKLVQQMLNEITLWMQG